MNSQPVTDARHSLHSRARIWPESNCYVDAWIGLVHTLDLDPVPMLLCALDSRFELDQWTLCKPSASELASLYGVRVERLNVWRDTREHVERQVHAGRFVLLDTDCYFLPDTAVAENRNSPTKRSHYRRSHAKTTIAVTRMRSDRRELEYLHNAGSFILRDDDFDGVFAVGTRTAGLPPFAEFVDASAAVRLDLSTLRERTVALAQRRLSRSAALDGQRNPFLAWAEAADQQLNELANRDAEHFHAWAFATVRQAGAMSDLLSRWCRWMSPTESWLRAATFFEEVARAMAAQQFRLANVPGGGDRPDLRATLQQCAPRWSEAHALVRAGIEPPVSVQRTPPWRAAVRSVG